MGFIFFVFGLYIYIQIYNYIYIYIREKERKRKRYLKMYICRIFQFPSPWSQIFLAPTGIPTWLGVRCLSGDDPVLGAAVGSLVNLWPWK